MEKVDDFCYLGSYISSNGSCENDAKVRIGKAAAVFGKMRQIWRNDNISLKVKTRLYKAIILSTHNSPVRCLCMAIDSNINEKSGCCTSQMAEEYTGIILTVLRFSINGLGHVLVMTVIFCTPQRLTSYPVLRRASACAVLKKFTKIVSNDICKKPNTVELSAYCDQCKLRPFCPPSCPYSWWRIFSQVRFICAAIWR